MNAIVAQGSYLYIGGRFTNAAGIAEADSIARWDGTNWSALGSNGSGDGASNAPVNKLALSGGNLYVGGNFTDAAGQVAADYLAVWDGSNWTALGNDAVFNDRFLEVAIDQSGNLWAGISVLLLESRWQNMSPYGGDRAGQRWVASACLR